MRRYERLTTENLRRLVEERLITKQQIADLLDMSRQAVDRRLDNGDLPRPIITIGQSTVWDKDEVLEYASRWKRLG